jgi:glycosyltransferase involved in cell wall biosynthesis
MTPAAPSHEALFVLHKACVLIPTYNNATKLAAVIEDVLQYTSHIVVVNDGSTDNTLEVLNAYPQLKVVSYMPNQGKGIALRTGIRETAAMGYDYAIAMDSDGQHYAKDLPLFLEAITRNPGALIVGARNMGVDNVPAKSSFGNKFSNFWYWVNTGNKLPDTQSGYRLYPVQLLDREKYFTRKYEFEIEVIVRASWAGIPVLFIPVSVYYPPPDERITHFRPFKDFSRISVLNTVLVTVAILWIKPRDFVKSLFSRQGWVKLWRSLFVNPNESNFMKAAAVGFGVFMGIVPIWGFQLAVGIPLAIAFRMNKALFLLAAHISVFPFTIFWIIASVFTGKKLLGQRTWHFEGDTSSFTEVLRMARAEGSAFFLGGIVLAVGLGTLVFLIMFLSLVAFRRKQPAVES